MEQKESKKLSPVPCLLAQYPSHQQSAHLLSSDCVPGPICAIPASQILTSPGWCWVCTKEEPFRKSHLMLLPNPAIPFERWAPEAQGGEMTPWRSCGRRWLVACAVHACQNRLPSQQGLPHEATPSRLLETLTVAGLKPHTALHAREKRDDGLLGKGPRRHAPT